jgi:hypothetical protein
MIAKPMMSTRMVSGEEYGRPQFSKANMIMPRTTPRAP